MSTKNLRAQLGLLKEIYHIVSPEDVREWISGAGELPERSVLVTCDDGLRNSLTDMAPILAEEAVSCLFFVLGASSLEGSAALWYERLYRMLQVAPQGNYSFDLPDSHLPRLVLDLTDPAARRAVWWSLVNTLSQYDQAFRTDFIETARRKFGSQGSWETVEWDNAQHRRFGLLRAKDLRQLVDMGMSIGSHTLNHPVLSQQPSELAWEEIAKSRSVVEKATGKPVWALAYPYGDPTSVTAREMQMAEQAGYECAFMNVGGGFGAALPRFAMPRVHVTAGMELAEFEAHISGFHRDFRARLRGEAL